MVCRYGTPIALAKRLLPQECNASDIDPITRESLHTIVLSGHRVIRITTKSVSGHSHHACFDLDALMTSIQFDISRGHPPKNPLTNLPFLDIQLASIFEHYKSLSSCHCCL